MTTLETTPDALGLQPGADDTFALCSDKNPCGNHDIWMRGDRVALTYRLDDDRHGPGWTGRGVILREGPPCHGSGMYLMVLWDGEDKTRVTFSYNIVLLPRAKALPR